MEEDPDDAQVLLMAASMEGRSALRGRRTRRRGVARNPEDLPHRCAAFEAYNLHADTRIPAGERGALERLCRYVLRPPLSKTRIEETGQGEIRMRLLRPWSSGPVRDHPKEPCPPPSHALRQQAHPGGGRSCGAPSRSLAGGCGPICWIGSSRVMDLRVPDAVSRCICGPSSLARQPPPRPWTASPQRYNGLRHQPLLLEKTHSQGGRSVPSSWNHTRRAP